MLYCNMGAGSEQKKFCKLWYLIIVQQESQGEEDYEKIYSNGTGSIYDSSFQHITDIVGIGIILSEQGFSSAYGGQANQAAAIALAYYKAACDPMIDDFMIRSYKDEAHEVAQGLAMGLKDANGKKKTAYNIFTNMDSSSSLKYTKKVLNSQVGNWKAQVPGYTAGRVSSMYRS